MDSSLTRDAGLSDNLKKDAKGALKTAVELLSVAASMTQNVPYLGIISSALAEFRKIQDVRGASHMSVILL